MNDLFKYLNIFRAFQKEAILKTPEEVIIDTYNKLPSHIVPVNKSKPPYMPYKRGYGYLGVLLLDTQLDKVQCHICGEWYKALSTHIAFKHKINTTQYKDKVGLFRKQGLISLSTKRKFKTHHSSEKMKGLREKAIKETRFKKGETSYKETQGSEKMAWKNRYGSCEAQIRFRLKKAVEKYGRVPYTKEEKQLYWLVTKRFGNWEKGLKFYRYNPAIHPRDPMKHEKLSKTRQGKK